MTHATKEQLETALVQTQQWLTNAQWDRKYAQDEAKKLREALRVIAEKCEQYWNATGIGDAEIHAVLSFIHAQASGSPSPVLPSDPSESERQKA